MVIALSLVGAGCSDTPTSELGRSAQRIVAVSTSPASFLVRESVNQVSITSAAPGDELTLFDSQNHRVASGKVDALGSLLFREIPSGTGYQVRGPGTPPIASRRLKVMSPTQSAPPQSFYADQQIKDGFGYITTRDGTKLSAAVYLPGPADQGPYPTVVEYSGYSPSNPLGNLSESLGKQLGVAPKTLCGLIAIACRTPDQPGSELAAAMGYAVVAVNVRGTGCSGGAYDFFEKLQLLDGYDVIEAVAAQPWVLNHKVGMVGLSYPGIAQLFVASTQPPSLAAITPLSVYDDTARGVLAPGGIFNEGFAFEWAREVLDNAKPYGQKWSKTVADSGDAQCAENQLLRLQNVDVIAKAKANPYYNGEVADPLNPSMFADKIRVPVFMSGAWQDEQTGPRFARLFDRFTNAPVKRFFAFNGAHADGFAPQILTEWKAFLDIYVAGKVTGVPPVVKQIAPLLFSDIFGVSIPFPDDRLSTTAPFAEVKTAYEKEQPIRVLFEDGAQAPLGAPTSVFSHSFSTWPFEGTTAETLYLQPDGKLSSAKPPTDGGGAQFTWDPIRGHQTTLPGDSSSDAFLALPAYTWPQDPAGKAAVFETEPLAADQVLAGTGNAHLWVRSSTDEADLEVTVSEIRPDGKETYVQVGVQRVSLRALAGDATELDPNPSLFKSTQKMLVPDQWTETQIEIFPFAHIFRAGSRIRISVHTPGGDRPRWAWTLAELPQGTTLAVATDAAHPSRVLLPLNSQVTGYSSKLPPCPSLRGQPCRTAVPFTNDPIR